MWDDDPAALVAGAWPACTMTGKMKLEKHGWRNRTKTNDTGAGPGDNGCRSTKSTIRSGQESSELAGRRNTRAVPGEQIGLHFLNILTAFHLSIITVHHLYLNLLIHLSGKHLTSLKAKQTCNLRITTCSGVYSTFSVRFHRVNSKNQQAPRSTCTGLPWHWR